MLPILVLAITLMLPAAAAAQTQQMIPAQSATTGPYRAFEMLEMQLEKAQYEARKEKKRQEEYKKELFREKTDKFVELWDKLARKINSGEVDAKLMKEVSKAFHDIEKSDGWIAK